MTIATTFRFQIGGAKYDIILMHGSEVLARREKGGTVTYHTSEQFKPLNLREDSKTPRIDVDEKDFLYLLREPDKTTEDYRNKVGVLFEKVDNAQREP